jgi:Sucrose-6F-phosphate phosphohydrolase
VRLRICPASDKESCRRKAIRSQTRSRSNMRIPANSSCQVSTCPGSQRVYADPARREEDAGWARLLDDGWSLRRVHAAASRCLGDRVHWVDEGTEHPHRVALSVHHSDVDHVIHAIRSDVERDGYKLQFIVSGMGEFLYVDVLSVHAGKRRATEHVRRLFGISKERVVVAGDSGNDILMLEGARQRAEPACSAAVLSRLFKHGNGAHCVAGLAQLLGLKQVLARRYHARTPCAGDTPGIVVGNAQPALISWAVQQQQNGSVAQPVLADKPLAHGILEGLARHGLY